MANQYTSGHVSQRDIVSSYVADFPQSTARQIADSLGMDVKRVSQELSVLKGEGRVVGIKLEGGMARAWSVSSDEYKRESCEPVRIAVKEWTGHARDDWHKLFYGAAAA